jgi:hypothetical protein
VGQGELAFGMEIYGISIRQPVAGDIVGESIALAAIGTAFEATYHWRLVRDGKTLTEGFITAGSMGAMETWVERLNTTAVTVAGPAVLELAGDDPSEGEGPDVEPARVSVIVIPGSRGYIPYLVRKGDTLTKILQELGGDPNVSSVKNTALASGLKNPDKIFPGQLLRIPV